MSQQEQIENRLIDKTIQQRNEILEKAKERADRILVRAETEKQRILDQTQQSIENIIGGELRAVHDKIVGGAQLQGRKLVMEARMEVIGKVFEQVKDEIRKIVEGPEWNDYLVKLTSESLKKLEEDCVVYANKEDSEYLKSNMESLPSGYKIKIEQSPTDIVGGVTVVNLEGTKTIHNILDARLEMNEDQLIAKIAQLLGVI